MEEDEGDPADGGEEAEREREEDAARRGPEEHVVAEKEDLVGAVVGSARRTRWRRGGYGQTHPPRIIGRIIKLISRWKGNGKIVNGGFLRS